MLSKCINPACDARFLYLRQGRLFKLEIRGPAGPAGAHTVEHFWLCDNCARTMTVVLDRGVVSARLLPVEPVHLAPGVGEQKVLRRVVPWQARSQGAG